MVLFKNLHCLSTDGLFLERQGSDNIYVYLHNDHVVIGCDFDTLHAKEAAQWRKFLMNATVDKPKEIIFDLSQI